MNKFYYELNNSNITGTVYAWTKNAAIAKIQKLHGNVSGKICHYRSLAFELFGAFCAIGTPVMLLFAATILRG